MCGQLGAVGKSNVYQHVWGKNARELFQQKLEERMSSVEVLAEGVSDGVRSTCDQENIKALLAESQQKSDERLTCLHRAQSNTEEVKSLARLQESTQERLDCLERIIKRTQSPEVQSVNAASQESIEKRLDSLEKLIAQQWRPFLLGLQKAVDSVGGD